MLNLFGMVDVQGRELYLLHFITYVFNISLLRTFVIGFVSNMV